MAEFALSAEKPKANGEADVKGVVSGAIHIEQAALCLDCGFITDGIQQCARCSSGSTLLLAPILNREEAAKGPDHEPVDDEEMF